MSTPTPAELHCLLVSTAPEIQGPIERALGRAGYAPHLETAASLTELDARLASSSASDLEIVLHDRAAPFSAIEVHSRIAVSGLSTLLLEIDATNFERLVAEIERVLCARNTRSKIESAQRQAQLARREGEERYRALVESTFDLVCELDAEGRVIYASPNFLQRLGFSANELASTPLFERAHPDEADSLVAKFAQLMNGQSNSPLEFRHAHKNGDWVWLEGAMRLLQSGQRTRAVLIARDIGERKRHERELAALISLAKAINAQREMEPMAREVLAHLQPLLPLDSVEILLLAGDELKCVSSSGANAAPVQISDDHPARQALSRAGAWLINRWNPEDGSAESARAFIQVPLFFEGEIAGVLSLVSLRPYVFTDKHARLANMAGEQVSVALRHVRLLENTLLAETKYRALVLDVDAIVWEAEASTLKFTFVSPRAADWLGFALDDWLRDENFWPQRIHPEDLARVLDARRAALESGEDFQIEYRVLTADNRVLWLRDLGNIETQDGQPLLARGLMVDITGLKQFELQIVERNTILKAVQEAAADGICVMDEAGVPVSFNRRFIEMWPIPAEMVDEARDKRQIMTYIASRAENAPEFLAQLGAAADAAASGENPHQTRDELRLADGRLFEVYSAPALAENGGSFGRVWSFRDITERERFEKQLTHQAFHDPLTDLPNRALFMDRLSHAIARSNRVARLTGVLFLDLDRFKVVNDSLGHPVGDELLKQVAGRVEKSTRPADTAARFGGDEFTVLVEDIVSQQDAVHVAERILEGLDAPFHLAGHEVHVSGSIGIALSTSPEDSGDDLIRKADVAMYWSKNRSGGRYEIFDTKMSAQALDRLQLEIDLRQAIKRDQLRLFYQPLVHLKSGRIIGAEALLRWQHPTRGVVGPDEFIGIAEETGLILPIGAWVLHEACDQARKWQVEFPHDPPLKISVNLSVKQLDQPNLPSDIAHVLRETQLDAGSLELEITESVVMQNVQSNIEHLETIKKLGVKLAIDDFGTGYSSLSYLEHFPLDALKIDRAFVGQIGISTSANGKNGNGANGSHGGNSDGLAILKAVSTLGRTLGVSVTAEGIETAEQRAQLTALSCEIGQGFHFAQALEPSAVGTLLRHNSRL
jgi:diguanylate cyclase (GGDEF)-like protein/PAS domain S-box-containing protein